MKYSSILPRTRPPRPAGAGAATARHPDVQQRCLDDRTDIEPVLLGDARMGNAPEAILALSDLGEALVSLEGIAAGGDEIDDAIESGSIESAVGIRGGDLGIEAVRIEGRGTGHAEHVLGKHVESAGADGWRVLRAEIVGVEGGAALHHFEAVGRNQKRFGRFVEAMVGAADTLGQPARALRCADMDDEIDVAPVDTEVEGRGADDGAQLAGGHRRLHLAALAGIERAVVEGDGQALRVHTPQLLKDQFGLAARIDEKQRHPVGDDRLVHVGECVSRRMAGPRHAFVGPQDGDLWFGAARNGNEVGVATFAVALPHQPGAQCVGIGDGRRKADRLQSGRQAAQAGKVEREKIAALVGDECVQLVKHHGVEIGEKAICIWRRQQQCGLLRRRQQNVGRLQLLALTLVHRRIAGAGLEADIEPDFGDRLLEVARDVDGKRLERRYVERVNAAPGDCVGRRALVQGNEARHKTGESLAGAGRCDEQGGTPGFGLGEQLYLMLARRPATPGKPGDKGSGQEPGWFLEGGACGHPARGNASSPARPSGGGRSC